MIKAFLLLLKFAKLGPVLKTGGTMLISLGAYAFIFGWRYALGFVLLIFAHEMGHFVAARRQGLDVGAPTFIPFVGAWIELKEKPMSALQEAHIAFAGPFVGTLAAVLVLWVAGEQDSKLLLALAYSGFFLNLFNLIPIAPFDGGRIVGLLSPKIWLLGVPLLLGIFIWNHNPMFLLVLVLLVPSLWHSIKIALGKAPPDNDARYYDVPSQDRIRYGIYYLLLVSFLAIMSVQVHEQLQGTLG